MSYFHRDDSTTFLPAAIQVAGNGATEAFTRSPASFGLSAQTKWRLVVSTPLVPGGRVGGTATLERGFGDRDFPENSFVRSRSRSSLPMLLRGTVVQHVSYHENT